MNKKQIRKLSLLFFVLVPLALFIGLYFTPHPIVGFTIGVTLATIWIVFDLDYK